MTTDSLAMLRRARRLQTDEDFAEFERAISLLAVRMDPTDLPELHRAFDDGTEDLGVYWSLVHLVKRYDYARRACFSMCSRRCCQRRLSG
jgi:hypothetical protein